jgi:hypothetical protein
MREWMLNIMHEQEGTIHLKDLDLFLITDDIEECVKYVNDFYSVESPNNKLAPNYEL